jgi:hypothetical protein
LKPQICRICRHLRFFSQIYPSLPA